MRRRQVASGNNAPSGVPTRKSWTGAGTVGAGEDGVPERPGSHAAARRRGPGPGAGERLGAHEGPGADAGDQEALGRQAFVRDGHRVAGHLETEGELPGGRQALTRSQPAVQDRLEQLPVDAGGAVAGARQAHVQVHDQTLYWPIQDVQNWRFHQPIIANSLIS